MCLKTFWGRVTALQIRECELKARPLDFDFILSDFSRVTRLDFGLEDLEGLLRHYMRRPRAIVASRPNIYSCARMFEWLIKRSRRMLDLEVFQDLESARAWLESGPSPTRRGLHDAAG